MDSRAASKRRHTSEKEISPTLKRKGTSASKQHQVCASCHSRRTELQQADVEKDYADTHSLALLESPLYYSDGQILDEVYVYGSFLQSKMHAAGVTCSNCHNPHSLKLKVGEPGNSNGVCSQCHNPNTFDQFSHHHHAKESTGAQCVNCHMPSKVYMGVDERHDHSFRIPKPNLSPTETQPNTCTSCHKDKTSSWASLAIDGWLKASNKKQTPHTVSSSLSRIQQGDASAAPELMAIAKEPSLPAISRATALLSLDGYFQHTDIETLKVLLADPQPLVRVAAVRSIQAMPVEYRFGLLSARLDERVLSVRVEMARQLADVALAEIPPTEAKLIQGLFDDFLRSTAFNADFPETQVTRGLFFTARGDYNNAEASYNKALILAPTHLPALLNLADLYRGLQRDPEGEKILLRALQAQPRSANVHYSLGLLYVRQAKLNHARKSLLQATQLTQDDPRYAYTYALILDKLHETQMAITFLQAWREKHSPNAEVESVFSQLKGKVSTR